MSRLGEPNYDRCTPKSTVDGALGPMSQLELLQLVLANLEKLGMDMQCIFAHVGKRRGVLDEILSQLDDG